MKTIKFAMAYGACLVHARRFTETEKPQYSEWFQDIGFIGVGDHIDLKYLTAGDMPQRLSDGAFNGCDNTAWILSDAEWSQYIALNKQRGEDAANKERNETIQALTKAKNAMEKQGVFPTLAEAARLERQYNDINNDGGYGYVPHFYSKEEYAATCEKLAAYSQETIDA